MKKKMVFVLFVAIILSTACSVSYKLEGGSINYDFTKTIHIANFPNRTAFYSPLTQVLDQALRRKFIEQTRLTEVSNNADIEIEGEITNYQISGTAVTGTDAYTSMTRLTITVKVDYINNKEANKDISQSFSAYREFDSARSIDEVEDELVRQIVEELVDLIYNATVANW